MKYYVDCVEITEHDYLNTKDSIPTFTKNKQQF